MRKILTTLSLGATLLAGAASAQTAPRTPFGVTPAADGTIARTAVAAEADRRFATLDTNRDGSVTPDEMRAARERMRGAPRSDGAPPRANAAARPDRPPLTAQAFRDRMLQRFDRADANHDGRLDATELQAMRDHRRDHRRGGPGGGPAGGPPAHED